MHLIFLYKEKKVRTLTKIKITTKAMMTKTTTIITKTTGNEEYAFKTGCAFNHLLEVLVGL